MSEIKTVGLVVLGLVMAGLIIFLVLRPQTWIITIVGIAFLGFLTWAVATNCWPPPPRR
jgi:predicted benzoate:H+ symporter BenE